MSKNIIEIPQSKEQKNHLASATQGCRLLPDQY